MARATGKEAIRLWYEFLKRAAEKPNIKINTKYYEGWGDYEGTRFNDWWAMHGNSLFPRNKVEVAKRYLSNADVMQLSIPKSLTPTAAANQVRDLLMAHYKNIGHHPKPSRDYQLTEGAEIKVSALRAYLHTYDIHQKILTSSSSKRVPAKVVLAEVRRFYLARSAKWKNSKRKVEGLPMALAGDFEYDEVSNAVRSLGNDVGAERAIRRYLLIANNLIHAAAKGDFPSKFYSVLN
ncbi:MAG: hypothetical protein B7Y05_07510 [Polynucleobacter sp. 24-46-87]|jgi:hypothetical protein|uniref:hypothetical protein n=1 Tax=Burkholderiales TaxID=80840 RepID=UPI000BD43DA6|nr:MULTISPECIES: hypothetical protein [Burkholderiales]OYY17170.1 MAG: hypothetical protein B7Y67_08445 [Polynucleobacter sp. 35-46-11]OZA14339.1 MAG: hypothetical protein B7Y05_07510 [Polynucleobacter sp. 24-46-87]HQR86936.1 hypothetical protein [Limnohabitans sp.]HQS26966.1 hypothetical protein [Limnohabitans sp.]